MKTFTKGVLLFMATILAAGSVAACSKPSKNIQPGAYDILGLGEIAVGMWVTPPAGQITEENYRDLKDAGINFVNGFREETSDNIKAALDLSEKYGLKFFVFQTEIEHAIKQYDQSKDKAVINAVMDKIAAYSSHPAYAGQLFMDEPGKPLFGAVKDFVNTYKSAYADKQWLVNMFPTYATGGIQAASYDDYMDTWLETIQPNYYSYDSYPCLESGGEIFDYYYNLDLVRSKTRALEIPFWGFIQTLKIGNTPGVPDKREPTREDIRWQVFSNLAFGAKGIQYFCYWTPGNTGETFGDAMIDRDGNKTERYGYVKELNAEFRAYSDVLVNAHAEGVILNKKATDTRFKLYTPALTGFGPVKSVAGDTFVAGCFTDKVTGDKSMLITSATPSSSADVVLEVESSLTQAKVFVGGVEKTVAVKDGKITMTVGKGDAVLIRF